MARIEIEESALESIKAMAQRLQEERDKLRASLVDCVEALSHIEERMGMRVNPPILSNARSLLDQYTSTPKVMELSEQDQAKFADWQKTIEVME